MSSAVDIVIYTTRTCPYCARAKELLKKMNLPYQEIPVDADPKARAKMSARANGRTTVPQIFFGETHVGGCDDLYALHNERKLDRILADLAQ
ncbi:MAG: glutaredoxin 3 [Beijerinckiaceae bacterium]